VREIREGAAVGGNSGEEEGALASATTEKKWRKKTRMRSGRWVGSVRTRVERRSRGTQDAIPRMMYSVFLKVIIIW
jgi:hypothetical protein